MHRALRALAVLSSAAAVGIIVSACLGEGTQVATDCPEWITDDCCPCPFPESCPKPDPDGRPWEWSPPWGLEPLNDKCCEQWKSKPFYTPTFTCLSDLDGGMDASNDGGSMGFCANGACVPPSPEAWKHVSFALSWPGEPPPCPDDAPILAFEGTAAPPDLSCPACSCDEPEGTCQLPTTWTVSTDVCLGGGGIKTNFDPPAGWDGLCSSDKAIAAGKLCGGVPCVRSITISPPVIEEKPCTPHTSGEADLPVLKAWNGGPETPIGRACLSAKPLPSCSSKGCGGSNSEFSTCVMHDGDQACPEGWNGDRHVLYEFIDDARQCTPCGCDAPTGGMCQVKYRTFSGPACSAENVAGDVYTGMMPSPCHDYNGGEALVGKTAEIVNYSKGSCVPNGGEISGDLMLGGQVTVCCSASTM